MEKNKSGLVFFTRDETYLLLGQIAAIKRRVARLQQLDSDYLRTDLAGLAAAANSLEHWFDNAIETSERVLAEMGVKL